MVSPLKKLNLFNLNNYLVQGKEHTLQEKTRAVLVDVSQLLMPCN